MNYINILHSLVVIYDENKYVQTLLNEQRLNKTFFRLPCTYS